MHGFRLFRFSRALANTLLLFAATGLRAQTDGKLAPDLRADVDRIAREVLASTGVPSASIAIVRDGQIAYVQAYGDARLEPRSPARTTCATASVRSRSNSRRPP